MAVLFAIWKAAEAGVTSGGAPVRAGLASRTFVIIRYTATVAVLEEAAENN
jgi:hypothetical protein